MAYLRVLPEYLTEKTELNQKTLDRIASNLTEI
jgi:hypothetical protein